VIVSPSSLVTSNGGPSFVPSYSGKVILLGFEPKGSDRMDEYTYNLVWLSPIRYSIT
jgi:hypothetical protein